EEVEEAAATEEMAAEEAGVAVAMATEEAEEAEEAETAEPVPTEAVTEEAGADEIVARELIDCEAYDLSDLRIGLVTDVGQINDKSFNQSSWEGVLAAELCGAEVDY